jgi:hypothetical protein
VFVSSHAETDAELIANAMSAAPLAISRDATVIAMDNDKMRTIRQGKGEFTCVSDDPGSPGNDPMCLDRNAMEWLQAWLDHKDAPKGKLGLVYMLQGGSDASNDDPFATKPPQGQKWVTTGPHVMMVGMAGMPRWRPDTPRRSPWHRAGFTRDRRRQPNRPLHGPRHRWR